LTFVAAHSIEHWVLRLCARAYVVDEFSVLASWYGSASIEVLVPVRKVTVVTVASLVDWVPYASEAFVGWLANSPHVEVSWFVTDADFNSLKTHSDGASIAWVLAHSSDKVSSILA